MRRAFLILITLASFVFLISSAYAMANPAAVYCKEMGYDYELAVDSSGNEYANCVMPDDSVCKDWDFFEGRCGKEFSYCAGKGYETIERKGTSGALCAVGKAMGIKESSLLPFDDPIILRVSPAVKRRLQISDPYISARQ